MHGLRSRYSSEGWLRSREVSKKKKLKKKQAPKKRPAARKRQSGKPNWEAWNKKRRQLATANARRRKGLPLTRLNGKQKPQSARRTRVVQHAIRVDCSENDCGTESRSVQTDLTLAELSDSPWEKSEAESRFADDVTYLETEDSSADGYWSDKAWSV